MKQHIAPSFFVVLLSFSVWASTGKGGCINCKTTLPGQPDTAELEVLKDAMDSDIQILADRICDRMLLALDMGGKVKPHEIFENAILHHLQINKKTANYRQKITTFWNQYSDQMICTEKTLGYKSPQHLLKRVVAMDAISHFYFKYFLHDRSANVNSIEYHNGKPETVIDFIDNLIADPEMHKIHNMKEVRQLRAFLTTMMGALPAKEILKG